MRGWFFFIVSSLLYDILLAAMKNLGATYSHRQIDRMKLSREETLRETVKQGFSVVRLMTYWDEIELERDRYDFSIIEQQLQVCETEQQAVVLTVGIKMPRWPEFHWPAYLSKQDLEGTEVADRLLSFVTEAVKRLQHFSCIKYWQVENEPLDPSGEDRQVVPLKLLQQEVAQVRSIDERPVILTAWGNRLRQRNHVPALADLADAVGIDLYPRVYVTDLLSKPIHIGPSDSFPRLKSYLANLEKPLWIMEVQAEPWEKDEGVYLSDSPASMNPDVLRQNMLQAQALQPAQLLLFGWEFILRKASGGDDRYMAVIKDLLNAS